MTVSLSHRLTVGNSITVGNSVTVTYFQHTGNPGGTRYSMTWADLCNWIEHRSPNAPTKDSLPLIKLATFAGNYRTDQTVEAVTGIEGDYDGERMQPVEARDRLQQAGITALVYTSPSHRPDAPRWRVLCPLSQPCGPESRRELVGRLNGILGGALDGSSESFTLSQAFYIGSVLNGHPVQCWRTDGHAIDAIAERLPLMLPARAQIGDRKPLGTNSAPSFADAKNALDAIEPNDLDYHKWRNASFAYRQAATGLTHDDFVRMAWDSWCARHAKNDHADNEKLWRSADAGTLVGWTSLHWMAYGKQPQPDPAKLFGNTGNAPAPQPAMPVPQPHDGYVEIIATATGDSGRNTLMETVKVLHGNLPVAFDEFTQTVIATHPLPWDKHSSYPRQWTELDTIHCQLSVQALFVKPGKDTVHDAVAIIAHKHKRHRVRDYLNGLSWDGIERLPHLATAYFGATDSDYVRIVGTKFMIGAVARIMSPGSKMDNVVILEGKQGTGKSSAIAMLAGPQWFTDELPDLHTKDAAIQLRGKWMIEVGELSALKRSDVETIKKFMARSTDTYRAPYERTTEDHPRQCVFVATTNDEHYLKDQSGNRRFWPLACGTINVDAIAADRDKLWAEAVARYRAGERWWLDANELQLAEIEQEDRREIDAWEARIAEHVAAMGGLPTTMANVCDLLGIDFERQNSSVTKRIAHCLLRAGYVRKRSSGPGRPWHYVPT